MSAITIMVLRWNRCLSKIWPYAGISVDKILKYPVLLWYNATIEYMKVIPRKKVSGADDQQERLGMSYWIAGFTDGEGCFSVAVIKNSTTKLGKQIFPEFVLTQGAKSLSVLSMAKRFFDCGSIILNKRYDNHNEHLYRYCIRSVKDLNEKIVPFFEKFPLRTHKRNDFMSFRKVVRMMVKKEHLTRRGWNKIMNLISKMNSRKYRS